jgi:predicted RNA binding protein YcfA (HicA-like mRNA interferase family)
MWYHQNVDRDELRRRMAQHPNSVSFNEARRVLEAFDWILIRVRGSHHYFRKGSTTLIIPLRRPTILQPYVRQILQATREEAP